MFTTVTSVDYVKKEGTGKTAEKQNVYVWC